MRITELAEEIRNVAEGRIVSPDEKTQDINGRTIRPGDIVTHPKFGKCQIVKVDLKTYSIPFVRVEVLQGKLKGKEIYRAANEFKKRG